MRYSSKNDTFYAFIGDVAGETRFFIYHIEGKSLTLTSVGEIGEENKSKFYDVVWNRKFIYPPSSEGFDLRLATPFSSYFHVSAPTSDIGGSVSSLDGA